ncbi:MAG: flagellar filament capping protein FliD [Planctomycetota bacterium]
MSGIQSSTGLASGLPINDIVDKLMSVSQQPRDRLEDRVTGLREQQSAVNSLTALAISLEMGNNKLADESSYEERTASSSDGGLLSASVKGDPTPGTHQFTPVRTAQNHQMVSREGFSLDKPVGEGSFSLGFGGFVDEGMDLNLLNGGSGVQRGKIRITDRSGSSEVVDLRFVQTVDEVLAEINESENINVFATTDGDAIQLQDQSGASATNLRVTEVNGGATAATLGLADIDAASSEVTGNELVGIYDRLNVNELNDGNGLSIRDELNDLEIEFRDGSSTLQIDLNREDIQTVENLLDALNAADPDRLSAELAADGKRLVLNDLTADDGGTFTVSSGVAGTLAEDLGLTTTASGGTLTGERLIGGLKEPLLSSLGGGNGLGTLGQIDLTDRGGASATVDLSSAETLGDVIDRINAAAVGVTAKINDARNGVSLRDTTGDTSSNLVVANADGTNSADALGLTIDAAEQGVDGGSLHLQTFHENLSLDSLNGGAGVHRASFLITDTAGNTSGVNLATSEAETVGDVIDLINGTGLAVQARVNDTGDGIMLVDTAGGEETLQVVESGTGTAAADLKLLGDATSVDVDGTPTQVIDGAMSEQISLDADDTFQDVVDKINELDMGMKAGTLQTGTGDNAYHLVLTSEVSGADGEIMLDTSELGLDFQQIARARDAVLQTGAADLPGAGVLATSSDNQFSNVVDGVELTVGGSSDEPVTISVDSSDKKLVNNANRLVEQYNELHDKIEELTYFDAESESTGILMGSHETLQIETRLSRLMSSQLFGAGEIESLSELGFSFKDNGQLQLDETKLKNKFSEAPEAVKQFFTDEKLGFTTKFNETIESLAGEGNSLLVRRSETLQRRIERHDKRVEFYNERLERERERLLKYYHNLELSISKMQKSQSALASLSPIQPMSGNNSSESSPGSSPTTISI